jgi:hypothetical protein
MTENKVCNVPGCHDRWPDAVFRLHSHTFWLRTACDMVRPALHFLFVPSPPPNPRSLLNRSSASRVCRHQQWKNVPLAPVDPILGVAVAYNADPSPNKINLGIGAYRDSNGKPIVLRCTLHTLTTHSPVHLPPRATPRP